ncbi:LytR/AlgR family response regulator transcription factor [Alteromonas halophila]|uniref:DNA-binding response regulator n=1 Tax=Alteromonas halophila TaxID=516698 RepID=A0A918JKZ9_9ALTE|nr:LytTR family DNA-binding domain-containing protein [Alteromonas halophila]GGW83955.1 DNA-binding response regulator [Alteromonas halophila]
MLNTLIVDDERLARAELKRLLRQYPQVNIVAEAENADTAIRMLRENEISLIFLDIQMPRMTGLEMAEEIDKNIQCVFCTAYDQYAADAFTLNATDYLVKPIEPERLAACVTKVENVAKRASQEPVPETNSYLTDSHGVLLKFGEINKVVRLYDIERFESIGNHTAVYSSHGKAYVHSSLSKIEAKLNPQYFFKANRGDVLRIDCIDRIEPGVKAGSSLAFLRSGHEIEISRRQVQHLKQLFTRF